MGESPAQVRIGDLLGMLSLAGDLGMGQPMEHAFRQTVLALRLAEHLQLPGESREQIACGGLLAWVGCHVDSYEQAKWFGDEAIVKAEYTRIDPKSDLVDLGFMLGHVGAGLAPIDRVRAFFSLVGSLKDAEATLQTHSAAVDSLAEQLGMSADVRRTIEDNFERWDGRGPLEKRAEDISITSRVIALADVAVAINERDGLAGTVQVARERRGTQFDPEIVDAFLPLASELFAELDALDIEHVVRNEPSLARGLSGAELDRALGAIADYTDVKSPFTVGHSHGVADLAGAAAARLGLPEADLVRHAGLLHDIGRLGVSNRIWDKTGQLSRADAERIRMHPYLTERALAWAPTLAPIAAIAVQHHERMDGSGYPRALSGPAISRPGRVLAVADTYRTKVEPRPHRPAASASEAVAHLRAEATAGRLDPEAVDAVLKAAGHRVRRRRETAGLTAREVEVLALVARGRSVREIAADLWITRKTASSHVEHIYAKLGVHNRALATLRAAQLGLLD